MLKGDIADTGVDVSQEEHLDLRKPSPYYARVISSVETRPGCWNRLLVGIYERNIGTAIQIGEYERNYPSLYRTFHPFKLRDKWYALYSKDYTCTRIMELPSCKDIGGEDRNVFGFCPVDYWVPPLYYLEFLHDKGCPRDKKNGAPDYSRPCICTVIHEPGCDLVTSNGNRSCTCKEARDKYLKSRYIWHFPDRIHGFIAGCVWGDDSSWKIEYLDLSRADSGIIVREARYGYIELPYNLKLNEAIECEANDDGEVSWISIAVQKRVLISGKEDDE